MTPKFGGNFNRLFLGNDGASSRKTYLTWISEQNCVICEILKKPWTSPLTSYQTLLVLVSWVCRLSMCVRLHPHLPIRVQEICLTTKGNVIVILCNSNITITSPFTVKQISCTRIMKSDYLAPTFFGRMPALLKCGNHPKFCKSTCSCDSLVTSQYLSNWKAQCPQYIPDTKTPAHESCRRPCTDPGVQVSLPDSSEHLEHPKH